MTMRKRLLALALTCALGLTLLSGCAGGDSSSSSSGSADGSDTSASQVEPMDLTGVTDPYLATAGLAGDTVVATVGESDITAAEVLYWLNYGVELYLSQNMYYGITQVPWDDQLTEDATVKDALMQSALETAAFYRVLPVMAQREGLTLPQETLDELEEAMSAAVASAGSEQALEHQLWYQMTTPDGYRAMYTAGEYYDLLQQLYYGEGTEGYPTDAEVLSYAQDELGVYRAKHILLLTKDMSQTVTNEDGTTGYAPLDEATIAEKKALADDLLAQLRAAEDPIALFDQLMNEYSEDTGLAANPDGYAFTTGEMVQEFEDATRALEPGQISGLVESSYGYHIILRLEPTCAPVRTMWNEDQLNTLTGQWVEQAEVVTTETYDNLSVGDFYDKLTAYRETLNTTSEEAEQENGQVEQDTGGELPAQDGTSDGQTQEDAGAQDSGSKDAAPQEEGAADQGEKAPDDAGGESTPEE